jgi:hypothetical protein
MQGVTYSEVTTIYHVAEPGAWADVQILSESPKTGDILKGLKVIGNLAAGPLSAIWSDQSPASIMGPGWENIGNHHSIENPYLRFLSDLLVSKFKYGGLMAYNVEQGIFGQFLNTKWKDMGKVVPTLIIPLFIFPRLAYVWYIDVVLRLKRGDWMGALTEFWAINAMSAMRRRMGGKVEPSTWDRTLDLIEDIERACKTTAKTAKKASAAVREEKVRGTKTGWKAAKKVYNAAGEEWKRAKVEQSWINEKIYSRASDLYLKRSATTRFIFRQGFGGPLLGFQSWLAESHPTAYSVYESIFNPISHGGGYFSQKLAQSGKTVGAEFVNIFVHPTTTTTRLVSGGVSWAAQETYDRASGRKIPKNLETGMNRFVGDVYKVFANAKARSEIVTSYSSQVRGVPLKLLEIILDSAADPTKIATSIVNSDERTTLAEFDIEEMKIRSEGGENAKAKLEQLSLKKQNWLKNWPTEKARKIIEIANKLTEIRNNYNRIMSMGLTEAKKRGLNGERLEAFRRDLDSRIKRRILGQISKQDWTKIAESLGSYNIFFNDFYDSNMRGLNEYLSSEPASITEDLIQTAYNDGVIAQEDIAQGPEAVREKLSKKYAAYNEYTAALRSGASPEELRQIRETNQGLTDADIRFFDKLTSKVNGSLNMASETVTRRIVKDRANVTTIINKTSENMIDKLSQKQINWNQVEGSVNDALDNKPVSPEPKYQRQWNAVANPSAGATTLSEPTRTPELPANIPDRPAQPVLFGDTSSLITPYTVTPEDGAMVIRFNGTVVRLTPSDYDAVLNLAGAIKRNDQKAMQKAIEALKNGGNGGPKLNPLQVDALGQALNIEIIKGRHPGEAAAYLTSPEPLGGYPGVGRFRTSPVNVNLRFESTTPFSEGGLYVVEPNSSDDQMRGRRVSNSSSSEQGVCYVSDPSQTEFTGLVEPVMTDSVSVPTAQGAAVVSQLRTQLKLFYPNMSAKELAELEKVKTIEDFNKFLEGKGAVQLTAEQQAAYQNKLVEWMGSPEGIAKLTGTKEGRDLLDMIEKINEDAAKAKTKAERDNILKEGGAGLLLGLATLLGAEGLANLLGIENPYLRFTFVLGLATLGNDFGVVLAKKGWGGVVGDAKGLYGSAKVLFGAKSARAARLAVTAKMGKSLINFSFGMLRAFGVMTVIGNAYSSSLDGLGVSRDSMARNPLVSLSVSMLAYEGVPWLYNLGMNALTRGGTVAELGMGTRVLSWGGRFASRIAWFLAIGWAVDTVFGWTTETQEEYFEARAAARIKKENPGAWNTFCSIMGFVAANTSNTNITYPPTQAAEVYAKKVRHEMIVGDRKQIEDGNQFLASFLISKAIQRMKQNELYYNGELMPAEFFQSVGFRSALDSVIDEYFVEKIELGSIKNDSNGKKIKEMEIYGFVTTVMANQRIDSFQDPRIIDLVMKEYGFNNRDIVVSLLNELEKFAIQQMVGEMWMLDPDLVLSLGKNPGMTWFRQIFNKDATVNGADGRKRLLDLIEPTAEYRQWTNEACARVDAGSSNGVMDGYICASAEGQGNQISATSFKVSKAILNDRICRRINAILLDPAHEDGVFGFSINGRFDFGNKYYLTFGAGLSDGAKKWNEAWALLVKQRVNGKIPPELQQQAFELQNMRKLHIAQIRYFYSVTKDPELLKVLSSLGDNDQSWVNDKAYQAELGARMRQMASIDTNYDPNYQSKLYFATLQLIAMVS